MAFVAGTTTVVDQPPSAGAADALKDVFALAGGGFEVVWDLTNGIDHTTYYRLFDSSGAPITDPIAAGTFQFAGPVPPHLQSTLQLADGTTLKESLVSTNPAFPPTEMVVQQFDQNGAPLGAPIVLGGTGIAGLVQLSNGDVVVVDQALTKTTALPIDATVLHNTSAGDTTAPTAVDFFPANGSNTLPLDWNIGITFSEAVKAGSGTITLATAAGDVVQTFNAASDPGIQFIGSSLVINPAADLQPGTTYKLIVAPGAVQDLAGNAYAGESGYTFTTAGAAPPPPADTTPPTAIDFFPAPGSNTLPPDWNLGITFNEAVKAGAGTITLETAAGDVVQTFAAGDPGIQFVGAALVINPAADLVPGTTYQLVVAPDAVEDLAGNPWAGESGFTFTAGLVGVPAA